MARHGAESVTIAADGYVSISRDADGVKWEEGLFAQTGRQANSFAPSGERPVEGFERHHDDHDEVWLHTVREAPQLRLLGSEHGLA